ncbi:hypothetical protein BRC86_10845 [Halobacteriales archaeon QS_3_64_16]|nr:MAG: hypothetical protein BRC86_10845 [Halobacteriales archaeon QS_3_64_16]
MRKPSVECALLAAMIAKHKWGSPIDREHLLAISAIEPNDFPDAREVFETLRSATYITNRGNRGIELDSSEFGALADVLYHDCRWEPFEIRSRLKHYEGWDAHEWA